MTSTFSETVQARETTVEGAQGCRLLVRDFGPRAAPAIVLVHGLGADGLIWRHQIDALADEHRVIVTDLRGHGRSDAPDNASYSNSSTWATDLASILEQTAANRPVLVGWSYGGLVVADYIAAHGTDLLAGIGLVAPLRKVGTDDAFDLLTQEFLGCVPGLLTDTLTESVDAAQSFVDMIASTPWSDSDRYQRLGAALTVTPATRNAMFARQSDTDSTWDGVRVPLYIAYGNDDRIVTTNSTSSLAERLPGASVSVYDGAGHAPFTDAPTRFSNEIREFVNSTR